jgi:hypothetical protein
MLLPLPLALFAAVASQVSVENPTVAPHASEGWSVDVTLGLRDVAPPWLTVGIEQRIDDNISIRAAIESGVFFIADRMTVDDARMGVASFVGPRFAFNPGDPFVLSAYGLGGIGTRSGAFDEPLLVERMIFHGALRLGGAVDWALSEHVSIRLSSDVVEGRTGWRLGAATLPAEKRISDQYTLLNAGIAPTLGIIVEL